MDRGIARYAFDVVSRVLGATVDTFDADNRVVDALMRYPDGRTAALEVSAIGATDDASGTVSCHRRAVPGVRKSWFVQLPRDLHPANMNKIDRALVRCEELAARELELAGSDVLCRELAGQGVRAWAPRRAWRWDPEVWVLPDSPLGATGRGAEDLPVELDAVLRTYPLRPKLARLAASGAQERHLFLHVRPSAFSVPVFDNLAFGGALPEQTLLLPRGLSQVWLLTGWPEGAVVCAAADRAWFRVDAFG